MSITELWLPIVLSGLATHILSTLAWTALPHHKPEWQKLPVEDELFDLLTQRQTAPGQYIFPFMRNPEVTKTDEFRQKSGKCSGMLVVWPNPIHMGKSIGLTFVTFMIIAFVIGYLASIGLPAGAGFTRVLQFATTAGLLAHVSAKFPFVFWFPRRIAMDVLDGVVFAVATGLIFAWLWP